MQFGISDVWLRGRTPAGTVAYDGNGGSLTLALGYSVASHFTLYVSGLVAGAANVTPRLDGSDASSHGLGTDVYGIGPGFSWDFGPNFFVSATLLLAAVDVTDGDRTLTRSNAGAALDLQIGKEWWVSDNWGLGISAQLIYGAMKGDGVDPTTTLVPEWSVTSLAALFSATYN